MCTTLATVDEPLSTDPAADAATGVSLQPADNDSDADVSGSNESLQALDAFIHRHGTTRVPSVAAQELTLQYNLFDLFYPPGHGFSSRGTCPGLALPLLSTGLDDIVDVSRKREIV